MLLILLSCLAICSANNCNLPEPINKTIDLKDVEGTWYAQYAIPGPPEEPYTCWKNIIGKPEGDGDEVSIASSAIDPTGEKRSITIKIKLLEPGNILEAEDFNGQLVKYTVLALRPHKCALFATCEADGNPAYYIHTAEPVPSAQEINDIEAVLQQLGLPKLSEFVKKCDDPSKY